ncbi:hypothetical protein, conserved [Eimeria necatrix]|uniref:Uncharacterized protein n=1 Tax=Eimeria necatrix TaxID=51315 RepID=U6MQR4_9EIME|nr:hypothetical protein, conserved [Eimeria necatrix]CDJ65428.1 hypothetical protein, conserved [Eimeria necatrix]
MRLRSRQEEAWAVQGLRLHALLRQQQQQAAAFVATMASGHLQLATQRLQVAHQQLKYALQRPVEKRLHAAFTKLRLLSTLTAAEQQTQKGRAVRLCCTIQRLQHRLLGEAFSKMRGARLMRQQQQDALQQLMQQMRLRRLRWSWQRLMWNMLVQRQACVAGSQRALFLVFICIKARMRSVLRLLQRNAAAANMEEKLRICSNIQQVNERLLVSMRQVPRQRSVMLLVASLQQSLQQRLLWAFRSWRKAIKDGKQRVRAVVLLMILLEMKRQKLLQAALSSLKNHVHDHREMCRQKMRAAWLLGLLLKEQQLQRLRCGWLCLQRPPPQDLRQTALRRVAFVFERVQFRQLRGAFLKFQQMQVTGRTMRAAAAASTTERSAVSSSNAFDVDAPSRVSAVAAAAASARLQQLLDVSSDLIGSQQGRSLSADTAAFGKPYIYLPPAFGPGSATAAAASAAAAASSVVAENYGFLETLRPQEGQENSEEGESLLVSSAEPHPTLLHLSPYRPRLGYGLVTEACLQSADPYDLGMHFGSSGDLPPSVSRSSADSSPKAFPKTRLVQPSVILSHNGYRNSTDRNSNNFPMSSKVSDLTDYAAQEAELVALVQGLQQAETRSAFLSGSAVTEPPVTSVAQGLQQQHPASTRVAPIEQLSSTAVLETPQREFLYGLSRDAPTAQVPTYSSCPTAVEEPLTPCPSPFRACCTTAVPPQ